MNTLGTWALPLFFALVGTQEAYAQQQEEAAPSPSPVVEIKQKLMYFRTGPGVGFGTSVGQNGEKVELGYFGGNIDDWFKDVPEALESARKFRTQKIAGFTMWAVGLAALLADLGYLTYVVAAQDGASFRGSLGLRVGEAAPRVGG